MVAISSVAPAGPPLVSTLISWKSVKVKSTENVITTAMIGVSSGEVIFTNICQRVAPSSVAASYSDGGTVCSPASSEIAMKGTPRQTLAKIAEKRAFQTSPRKLMLVLSRPIFFSDHEITENCGSKIHQKAMADSTVGTMNGISTTARISALNGSFSLSRIARYRPTPNFTVLATTV